MTQSCLASRRPWPRCPSSIVPSVVASPQPMSSARARRTSSRYSALSSGISGAFTRRPPASVRVRRVRRWRRAPRLRTCGHCCTNPDAATSARAASKRGAGRPPARSRGSRRPACAAASSLPTWCVESRRAPTTPSASASSPAVSPAPPIGASTSSAVGQAARCTEPSFHHDHTSSVTYGRNGANRRSSVSQRDDHRGVGRARALGAEIAVAARLHELEVVVAEVPEELLGALERARVVVLLEVGGGVGDERREPRHQPAIDRRGDRRRSARCARARTSRR